MKFTNAYLPASVCSPSRYSLLSGRYWWRNPRHPSKGVIGPSSPSAFHKEEITMQSMLKGAGYQTYAMGKWHLGIGDKGLVDWSKMDIDGGPCDHGFDAFFGSAANAENAPKILIENRRFAKRKAGDQVITTPRKDMPWKSDIKAWDPSAIFRDDVISRQVTDRVIASIEDAPKDQPFFIYWPTHIPHKPITPHSKFKGSSKYGPYGDFMLELDAYVGEVIAALKEKQQLDNTLIIFSSDNGGLNPLNESFANKWGMKEMWKAQQEGHVINGPLNEGKHSMFDGGFRVPLIVKWPGKIKGNTSSDELVCITDLMATLASALDIELPPLAAPDSLDLSPLLMGKSQVSPRQHVVLGSPDGTFALRRGPWKYIEKNNKAKRRGSTEFQLYHIDNDIGERKNLIDQHPEVVADMQRILDQERSSIRGIAGAPSPRPKTLAKH